MNNFEPVLFVFACQYCTSLSEMNLESIGDCAEFRVIGIPCSGRVGPLHILRVFEMGVDGICILGCSEGRCHYLDGNFRAEKRVCHLKKLLSDIGIKGERLEFYNLSEEKGRSYVEVTSEFAGRIKKLGPNPIRMCSSNRKGSLERKSNDCR